jgi:hypothetical protein
MQTRRRDLFTTVTTEGAILPADLPRRIVERDSALDGLSPAEYHLAEGEKLNEALNRSWNRLVGVWSGFQSVVARALAGDPATTATREKWLLPLFQELGYGRLLPARVAQVDGKSYAVSHSWQHAPIHLVGFNVDPDRRQPSATGANRTSPHSLIQEFLKARE